MNLSELQTQLKELDLQPSRKLGQSFLIDENISSWIAAQLHINENDVVIEVGPGFGALTQHLAGNCRRLILIEKDGRLAAFLQKRFGHLPGVEIRHQDATEFDIRELFEEGAAKLIGNLPYSVGNEILRKFLDAPSPITQAVVMVQKEVGDRFCAVPRTKAYGILGLMLQHRWHISTIKTVGPNLFHPRPEVDSSILRFDPRPEDSLPFHCPEIFSQSVKRGFAQRRKQLRKNLQIENEKWGDICGKHEWSETLRAEELSLPDWILLSNEIDPHPCAELPPSSEELLEYVDENDQVLGTMRRGELHAKKKLHRAVHVFLFNKKEELYLQLRSCAKDTHANKWDSSASGHVDPGESYEDCAHRELWEELWVRSRIPLQRVARLDASDATDQEFIEVFRAELKGKVRVHGSEIHSGRFFTIEQIESWIDMRPQDFATGFVTCFRIWKSHQASDNPISAAPVD